MTTRKGTKQEIMELCKDLVQAIGLLKLDAFYAHYYGGGVKDSTIMTFTKKDMLGHLYYLMDVHESILAKQEEAYNNAASQETSEIALYNVEFTDNTELYLYAYSREDAIQEAEKRTGKTGFYAYFIKSVPVEIEGEEVYTGEIEYSCSLCGHLDRDCECSSLVENYTDSISIEEKDPVKETSMSNKPKISLFNVGHGQWQVVNSKAGKWANIYAINEYNAFSDTKKRYRVDVNGLTVASLIDHFQTAKSIATKHIQ